MKPSEICNDKNIREIFTYVLPPGYKLKNGLYWFDFSSFANEKGELPIRDNLDIQLDNMEDDMEIRIVFLVIVVWFSIGVVVTILFGGYARLTKYDSQSDEKYYSLGILIWPFLIAIWFIELMQPIIIWLIELVLLAKQAIDNVLYSLSQNIRDKTK